MAPGEKDDQDRPVELIELDDLLPAALRIAAARGDSSEQELSSTLIESLKDPSFESRLESVFDAEGVSPELRRQYLRMIAEWRRALERIDSATETIAGSSGRSSAPQRKSSS